MSMHVLRPLRGGVAKLLPTGTNSTVNPEALHHQWADGEAKHERAGNYAANTSDAPFLSTPHAHAPAGHPAVPVGFGQAMLVNVAGVPMLWPVGQMPQGGFMFANALPFAQNSPVAPCSDVNEFASEVRDRLQAPVQGRRQRRDKPPADTNALTSEEIGQLRLAVQNTVRKLQNPNSTKCLSSLLHQDVPCFADGMNSDKSKDRDVDTLPSSTSTSTPDSPRESWEDASIYNVNAAKTAKYPSFSDTVVDRMFLELESTSPDRQKDAIEWIVSSTRHLSLTGRGCRIVQRALEIATLEDQQRIVENLEGFVLEALQSPHANYVLQKCFEVVPRQHLMFVLRELKGQAVDVAKHRFGCRILQRIIEHCSFEQNEGLIAEVLSEAPQLIRHTYGNFVIQHILQYGTSEQVHEIAVALLAEPIRFAKHRIASHVMSCAVSRCSPEDVQSLTDVLLGDEGQLADLSRRQYGSYVVREINRVNGNLHREANN